MQEYVIVVVDMTVGVERQGATGSNFDFVILRLCDALSTTIVIVYSLPASSGEPTYHENAQCILAVDSGHGSI